MDPQISLGFGEDLVGIFVVFIELHLGNKLIEDKGINLVVVITFLDQYLDFIMALDGVEVALNEYQEKIFHARFQQVKVSAEPPKFEEIPKEICHSRKFEGFV